MIAAPAPIAVTLTPDEASRTPDRPCCYDAVATVGGRTFTARARSGLVGTISRVLIEAGIADAPLVVSQPGIAGSMRYRSFHRQADFAIEEGRKNPIGRRRYVDPAMIFGRPAKPPQISRSNGQSWGKSPDRVSDSLPTEMAAE